MRVTKITLAKAINEWLDKVEISYSVSPDDIERTQFTFDQYEGGATHHHIVAKHKTDDKYSDLYIYTMQTMNSMQQELNNNENSILTIENFGSSRHRQDFWVVIK